MKRKILTEADLRAARVMAGAAEYHVPAGTFVTPLAAEYLRDRKIALVVDAHASMTRTPMPPQGAAPYVDRATGAAMAEKGEGMTHLRGNVLVPKTHPRIAFRGQLDQLQAAILLQLADAKAAQDAVLARDLSDLLGEVQRILSAEVRETPLPEVPLLGMTQAALRHASHHVRETFGFDHPIPDADMPRPALALNLLRTQVRQAELAAAQAFAPDTPDARADLICHLNRLSSAVYLVFCRVLARTSQKEGVHGPAGNP